MPGFTQSALLKALGWSLFDSLWQMALLCLCYILFTSVFKKASAGSRHGLIVLLLGVGAACFGVSFSAHYVSGTGRAAASLWPGALTWLESSSGPALGNTIGWLDAWAPWCSFAYLVILAFLLARYTHHFLHTRKLKEEAVFKVSPALIAFIRETARKMGIKKRVRIGQSDRVESPVTMGFLRPVILIPIATINHLSLEQVEAVLLHELGHIKRHDYLVNLVVTVLELFFFFNPFTRMLIRHLKKEREHRCDDLVIQYRYDPRTYVSALLSLATLARRRQALVLAATGRNNRFLLQRVQRILKQEPVVNTRTGARPVLLLLLTAMTVFLTLARPMHRQDNRITITPILSRIPEFPQDLTLAKPSTTQPDQDKTNAGSDPNPDPNQPRNELSTIECDPPMPPAVIDQNDGNGHEEGNDQGSASDDEDDSTQSLTDVAALVQNGLSQAYSVSIEPTPPLIVNTGMPQTIFPSIRITYKKLPDPSFSFRWIEDTARSGKNAKALTYAEAKAGEQRAVILKAMVVNKTIIDMLENRLKNAGQSQDQQKVQRSLLQQQQGQQKKMEKAIRKLTIVYI